MKETLVLPSAIETREKLLTELYKKTFPAVAKYIQKRGGSFDEAKDIFHDALVVYYEKSLLNTELILDEKAYLMGISKHLWAKRFREKTKLADLQNPEENIPLSEKEETASSEKLLRFLETAGGKCMELLRDFYYNKLSPNEIADRFGFSGIRSATVQKFKCLEKVRNSVKEKSLHYEDFLD